MVIKWVTRSLIFYVSADLFTVSQKEKVGSDHMGAVVKFECHDVS